MNDDINKMIKEVETAAHAENALLIMDVARGIHAQMLRCEDKAQAHTACLLGLGQYMDMTTEETLVEVLKQQRKEGE